MGDPVFLPGWEYFEEHLSRPGGLVEYVTAFLSQGYYYSWLGALIITLTAWLTYLCAKMVTGVAGESRSEVICYVPALLLLVIYNRYNHPLPGILALLIALCFFCAYERAMWRRGVVRGAIFAVAFIALYYIAAGASLLFCVLVGIYELLMRRRKFLAGFAAACGLAAPYLASRYFLSLDLADAYGRFSLWASGMPPSFAAFFHIFFAVILIRESPWRKAAAEQSSQEVERGGLKSVLRPVALLFVLLAVVIFLSTGYKKRLFEINYFARHKMWPELLRTARELPRQGYNAYWIGDVNRALYHTGRFGDEMFSYPQRASGLIFFPESQVQNNPVIIRLQISDICLELGDLNLAEKMAYEAFEAWGDHPYILQRLALINIVKGQIDTSRVFLNALAKELVYGGEARSILSQLESDPHLSSDKQIQQLRSVMWSKDYASVSYDEEYLLLKLLQANRHNRMAFEYLMGFYLVNKKLDKIAANIGRLDDFEYKEIPRHYAEALLIHIESSGQEVDLRGRRIRAETVKRFDIFSEKLQRFRADPTAAQRELSQDYGQSYFFYFLFGRTTTGK